MTALVDTSIMIDWLRGVEGAVDLLERERLDAPLHASEIAKVEVLAGMRPTEEAKTRAFLAAFQWHATDESVAEEAGALGRRWLTSHQGIDTADLVIAATAVVTGTRLLTLNVRHFPMFPGLSRPY
jgi:predicted nucleic acid-binding protein